MWIGEVNLANAFTISAMGLSTVFLTLISLAIAVIVVSKVLLALGIGKKEEPKASATPAAAAKTTVATDENDETYAAIVAAVSEEMKLPIDKFRIVEITEIA